MSVRICHSCGATNLEAAFPAKVKGQPRPKRCLGCMAAPPPRDLAQRAQTRASYRAAHRHRAKSDQLDLVDMLRPPA